MFVGFAYWGHLFFVGVVGACYYLTQCIDVVCRVNIGVITADAGIVNNGIAQVGYIGHFELNIYLALLERSQSVVFPKQLIAVYAIGSGAATNEGSARIVLKGNQAFLGVGSAICEVEPIIRVC